MSTYKLIKKDYITSSWNKKYDGIICNPPYFKFHDFDNKTAIQTIESKLKCKLSGFTNLYALFLLKSLHQLRDNGRCAYIVPSEFLNSDYGVIIKKELLKTGTLRHIVVINFKENVFDDALTTASIILCAKDNFKQTIGFTQINSLKDLELIGKIIDNYSTEEKILQTKYVPVSDLNPDIKWKAYYKEQNKLKYSHLIPFSKYGKVVRGIATGSNEYFVFNKSKAKKYNIAPKFLLPCICRSCDVKTTIFTTEDFEILKAKEITYLYYHSTVILRGVFESVLNSDLKIKILPKHIDT